MQSKPKKIAIFCYSLGPGGAERVVSNSIKYLKNHYEIELILMNENIFYPFHDVKIHFLQRSKPDENDFYKAFKLFFLSLKLKKLCKEQKYQSILVYLSRPCYIACLAKLMGLKTKVIINECSTPLKIYKGFSLKAITNRLLIHLLYKRANLLLANSKASCIELENHFKTKAIFIPNMIDLENIRLKSKEGLEEDFNEKSFILNIGRLDEGKNHLLLIKAYKALNTKLSLLIIGDGPLKNELLQALLKLGLEKRVFLLGLKDNVYKYLARARLFVCTSEYEGFSNVLIEALASDCFIVSTEHENGAKELINSKKLGFLSPIGDEKALIKNIKLALKEEDNKEKKLARIARLEEFDMQKIGKSLCELL